MIRASGRYDARVNESLARAFPARLAPAVVDVARSLPGAPSFLRPGSVTVSNSRTWPGLVVTGELVVIPNGSTSEAFPARSQPGRAT